MPSWADRPRDPDFDLAWDNRTTITLVEVESLASENETRQLRLGLGQVLHHRHNMTADGAQPQAVLYVERQPSASGWQHLCTQLGVKLAWPGNEPF